MRNRQTGALENEAAPIHILLAHEFIHSDHSARGTGAFNNEGLMYQGGFASVRNPNNQFTQQRTIMGRGY